MSEGTAVFLMALAWLIGLITGVCFALPRRKRCARVIGDAEPKPTVKP